MGGRGHRLAPKGLCCWLRWLPDWAVEQNLVKLLAVAIVAICQRASIEWDAAAGFCG